MPEHGKAANMTLDIVIFAMPIPLLAKVKINRRRKLALIAVFSLGAFTTVCSIMRMVQISVIAINGNSTMLVLWGTIEMNVGVSIPSTALVSDFFAANIHADFPYMPSLPNASFHLLRKQDQDKRIWSFLRSKQGYRHE